MRSLEDTRTRWQATRAKCKSFSDLKRSVRYDGSASPAIMGCRSVCWKTFLLFRSTDAAEWAQRLLESRSVYAESRDRFLKFIKHPEALATLTVDPLADDPESPWNSLRQDEIVRDEIAQDVRRLPDEPFYHEPRVQTMIIDILFVHCKLNPKNGGYRQGMHELLAPILGAIEADAAQKESCNDALMADVLDFAFVEHDAFALFSAIMESAGQFYEVNDGPGKDTTNGSSVIVEKSKFIHERCLMRVDPELAAHLKAVEILPQIFLIRWIRLLFGREFPLDQLLVFWDILFAVDSRLDLIDLICVAMLLRVRWQLLEADYSVCLQLLLKYPVPQAPHGPHTFVEDALYLRDHLSHSGATSLIMKYTGRTPKPVPPSMRVQTPSFQAGGFGSLRVGGGRGGAGGTGGALPSPSRFIQNQGGVEALFQTATKGVLERGERLGINQAVRDAVGEIRRNVQNLQEARQSPRRGGGPLGPPIASRLGGGGGGAAVIAAMGRRNKQLAVMLDEIVDSLKAVVDSGVDDKAKSLELIELAAARVQFVKTYLEDATMEVPEMVDRQPSPSGAQEEEDEEEEEAGTAPRGGGGDVKMGGGEPATPDHHQPRTPLLPKTPVVAPDPMPAFSTLTIADMVERSSSSSQQAPVSAPTDAADPFTDDAMDMDMSAAAAAAGGVPTSTASAPPPAAAAAVNKRPAAPIPTRSTLAQSSFAWMLEPDSQPSQLSSSSPAASSSSFGAATSSSSSKLGPLSGSHNHRKRPSGGSGGKNAFLFGEVVPVAEEGRGGRGGGGQGGKGGGGGAAAGTAAAAVTSEEIFGLQPLRSRRGRTPL